MMMMMIKIMRMIIIKNNDVIDSNKSNFIGVSGGVCTATPGSQGKS